MESHGEGVGKHRHTKPVSCVMSLGGFSLSFSCGRAAYGARRYLVGLEVHEEKLRKHEA